MAGLGFGMFVAVPLEIALALPILKLRLPEGWSTVSAAVILAMGFAAFSNFVFLFG